jgi:hypothetical protein
VINITLDGRAVATSAARALTAVPGACPRGVAPAQPVQDRSGSSGAGSALPVGVVVARPRTQHQKYPFMTQGAGNGTKLGPHRAWDPV